MLRIMKWMVYKLDYTSSRLESIGARDSLHLSNLIRRRSSLFRPSLPALSLALSTKYIPLTVFRPAPPPLSQPAHPRISSLSRWSIQINLVFSKSTRLSPPEQSHPPAIISFPAISSGPQPCSAGQVYPSHGFPASSSTSLSTSSSADQLSLTVVHSDQFGVF
ncbi:hypothetical protein F2Q69_00026325 [Brassica cretica]|uniref:Uncharacterized protein n=1 Tax=Brassica cretica TaxID=69181 RepID=A0A8S9S4S2_BRACR|nr:hypothetical protein F2Q69_00026325 [Brassica cretica]